MCGIFAVKYFDAARSIDPAMVKEATDLMHHRGPDDFGYYVSNNIGLGHRRLSIIDLSTGFHRRRQTGQNRGKLYLPLS